MCSVCSLTLVNVYIWQIGKLDLELVGFIYCYLQVLKHVLMVLQLDIGFEVENPVVFVCMCVYLCVFVIVQSASQL